jgi:hypothetical protein
VSYPHEELVVGLPAALSDSNEEGQMMRAKSGASAFDGSPMQPAPVSDHETRENIPLR